MEARNVWDLFKKVCQATLVIWFCQLIGTGHYINFTGFNMLLMSMHLNAFKVQDLWMFSYDFQTRKQSTTKNQPLHRMITCSNVQLEAPPNLNFPRPEGRHYSSEDLPRVTWPEGKWCQTKHEKKTVVGMFKGMRLHFHPTLDSSRWQVWDVFHPPPRW